MTFQPADHLCLIDGSSFLHRAWNVIPKDKGEDAPAPGRMQRHVATMFAKLLERMRSGRRPPTHLCFVFDPPRENSWRRKQWPQYKATRPDPHARFVSETETVCQALAKAGFAVGAAEEHEADDVIAAYANDAAGEGAFVTMISTDKDLMQMIEPGIIQFDARGDRWFGLDQVNEKFGVPPARIGDFLALSGDVADGIPGVKGIGPKKALKILAQGPLDKILDEPDRIEDEKLRKMLVAGAEDLRIARRLIALDTEGAPRLFTREQMAITLDGDLRERLHGAIDALEATMVA